MTDHQDYNTLLLSAGGIKGYAFLGVWKYLQENNISHKINTFSGISIGSFFSLWFILGFTFEEIYQSLIETNILNLFSFDFVNFFESYGMIDICELENFIINKMEEKGFDKDITFQSLYEKTNKELHTFSFCVNEQKLESFNKDTTPHCSIRKAVLMSLSIPIIFQPIHYNNKLYVDGAVKKHLPILENYNDSTSIPCVLLKEDSPRDITNIFDYVFNIVSSIIRNKKQDYIGCCKINTNNVGLLDVGIEKNEIDQLIQTGFDSISTWINEDNLS